MRDSLFHDCDMTNDFDFKGKSFMYKFVRSVNLGICNPSAYKSACALS